jgi:hypothetical protein
MKQLHGQAEQQDSVYSINQSQSDVVLTHYKSVTVGCSANTL